MNVHLVPADQLSADHLALWSRIINANPDLQSPFLQPEFVQAVATVRPGVEVAVLDDGADVVGFFPFQRDRWDIGKPVAAGVASLQAVIIPPDVDWEAEDLVRQCGLRSWTFDHLVVSQQPLQRWHGTIVPTPYLDLSAGFDAYFAARRRSGSNRLRNAARFRRKLAREVGPVTHDPQADDRRLLDLMIRWKSDQFRRRRVVDTFAFDWVRELLMLLFARPSESLQCLLSVVYVNDEPIAIDVDLRTGSLMAGWFTAYNPKFARYSPGSILMLFHAENLPGKGVTRYELGTGPQEYKRSFASGEIPVARGSVACTPMARLVRSGWRFSRRVVRNFPLEAPARLYSRFIKPVQSWATLR